jgi:hypothetical protein
MQHSVRLWCRLIPMSHGIDGGSGNNFSNFQSSRQHDILVVVCGCTHSIHSCVCVDKCKESGKMHVGSTQKFFNNRMRGHFQDVKQFVKKGAPSDSHAKHFGGMAPSGANTPPSMHAMLACNIQCRLEGLNDSNLFELTAESAHMKNMT